MDAFCVGLARLAAWQEDSQNRSGNRPDTEVSIPSPSLHWNKEHEPWDILDHCMQGFCPCLAAQPGWISWQREVTLKTVWIILDLQPQVCKGIYFENCSFHSNVVLFSLISLLLLQS